MKTASKGKSARKLVVPEFVSKRANEMKEKLADGAEKTRSKTRSSALGAARSVVGLQQKAFDTTLKYVGKVQDKSEKALRKAVKHAHWMPEEGKEVVEEWVKTMHDGRVEFKKTVDKSFSLFSSYLKRVQANGHAEKAAAASKGKPKARAKSAAGPKAKAPRKRAAAKSAVAKETATA